MNEDDPIEQFRALQKKKQGGLVTPPTDDPNDPIAQFKALKATKQQSPAPIHARQPEEKAPLWERINDTFISGFPGAQRAVAGYRGLADLAFGSHTLEGAANEVETTMKRGRKNAESLPGYARIPLQIAGGIPASAALAPLGAWGGAAFGAAQGADKPASSIDDRTMNTVTGGLFGKLAQTGGNLAGKGIKNLSDRSGASDWLANVIKDKTPNLAAAMGSRGQVNEALGKRQDILSAVGDPGETGAKLQMDRIANTKAQAKSLYDAARADTKVIQDPELNALLTDPQIQKAYQAASELRAASGNPLQRVAAPEQVPLALQKMGVSPERYAELQAVGQSRRVPMSGVDILPPELMGEQAKGVEMPDPDVLAKVKRYISQAAYGRQNSPLAINQDEARALLPKVDAIRQKLHEVSPAWKQADAFYAQAKGEEEAFQNGFDAFRVSKNPKGAQLPEHSPEAMLQAIQEPRYPGEPPEALQGRADAFRQGMRAAATGQVKGKPVERGLSSILKSQALAPTESGVQTRSLMFPQSEEQKPLESLLARLRGESNQLEVSGAGGGHLPVSHYGMMRSLARLATQSPDLIERPAGQQLLMERFGLPSLLQSEIGASNATYQPFKIGSDSKTLVGSPSYKLTDFLANLAKTSVAGQATR